MTTTAIGVIREFRTKHFRVIVDAIPEDSPDLSWDETGETAQKIDNGTYVLFCARVRVMHDELGELGSDYLGNCVYETLADFEAPKSYFQDMVRQACRSAREQILEARRISMSLYVRFEGVLS